MNTDYLIGWVLGNALLFLVMAAAAVVAIASDGIRRQLDARRREEARREAEQLKVIAIDDFRRRERLHVERGGAA